jgi:hypothetical protein
MSILKQITDDITALQSKIPEDLLRIKDQLQHIVLSDNDVKNHPYVVGLTNKNRVLRKKIRTLEKQLLNILLTGVNGQKELIVIDNDDNVSRKPVEIKTEKGVEIKTTEKGVEIKTTEKGVEIKTEKGVETNDPVENITFSVEEEEIEESSSFSYPYPRDRVEPEYPTKKQPAVVKEEVVEEEEEVEEVEEEEEEVEEVEEVEEEEVEEVEEVGGVVQGAIAPAEVEEVGGVVQGAIAPAEEEEEVGGVVQGAIAPAEEEEVGGVVQGAIAPAEEEEEESVYEVSIKGKTYYVMNEIDSIIYDVDENGDISLEVGIYKEGKPVFYKKK